MTKNHDFNFDGGEYLTSMGATWFVSYSFHSLRDKTHKNWEKVGTHKSRSSVFNRTAKYHKFWLQQILNMNDSRLNTNELGLKAIQIKLMASVLIVLLAQTRIFSIKGQY